MSDEAPQTENRFERAQRLALEIVDECRVQLMMKFRFLDLALWKMDARPTVTQGRYTLSTDGTHVYFEPYTVLGRFDAGFDEMVRDYLHMVMHCLFRHPFDTNHGRIEAWWLVCDVMAEQAAMELCGDRFTTPLDVERRAAIEELTKLCNGRMTPGNLYGLFLRSIKAPHNATAGMVSGGRLNELRTLFERDHHRSWPSCKTGIELAGDKELITQGDGADQRESDGRDMVADSLVSEDEAREQDVWDPAASNDFGSSQEETDYSCDATDEDGSSSGDAREGDGEPDVASDEADDDTGGNTSSQGDEQPSHEKSEEEQLWEELAKQVEMDLQTFSKEWGYEAGSFMKTLAAANRKKYDYAEFLRRFATLSEEMKINDDEFDYVFYTFGLNLYGNMPLIEPLEYKETHRVRDFVICLDTSESCEGDLVRRFVEHTFNLLKQQEDYTHKVNIHVIQCDSKVQADTKIEELRDVDKLMEKFTVRGFGGTDFRPAFSYVNELVEQRELPSMKGVIYFTDGLGEFPEKAPDYDVAFVFMDEGDDHIPKVPPWAMRILIDEAGIDRLKSELG